MGARFGRGRVFGATVFAALAALLMMSGAAAAATPAQDISSSGPLTDIWIGNDLSCQVAHSGDASFELYGQTEAPGDCGTFVSTGGTLYAPDFANHSYTATGALGPYTPFTAVSQTSVTGSGTSGDPYRVVTVADVGTTGLRITQTDSYVVGQEVYRTDVQVANSGSQAQSLTLYRAGDCYLQGSDNGYGATGNPTGAVACVAPDPSNPSVPGTRTEQWAPLTSGSHYLESFYRSVWSGIAAQTSFPDSCECTTNEDNGAGLSWGLSIPAGGSATVSNLTNFSPTGRLPLTTSKAADAPSVGAGAQDGYTITLSNPNTSGVQVASISDTLPAGFSYVSGSTTGVTTSDPTTSGQTLTWTGLFTDPAASSISLHFEVTTASTPGTYFNNATADAGSFSVVATGNTAPVAVTAVVAHTLTVSKAGTGTGSVSSSPAGISCGGTCSASFANGTMVTLTATAAAGSTFAGWSGGGCSGTGTCTVTLNADTTVTATFTLQVFSHALTVTKAGTGSGSVTSSPAGIDCGSTCVAAFVSGSTVTLTATPAAGSTFTGWSGGGCSGTGTCTVTLNADTTVTATFTTQPTTARARQAGWWKTHDADTSPLLPVTIGNYAVTNLTTASAVFAANNCGASQGDGVGCLAAELLAAKLNLKNGSDPCIASTTSAADAFLVAVGYSGPGSYTLSDTQRSQALSLKNDLQHYDGSGNC